MKLTLQRQASDHDCTIGSLYVNGSWQCFTLEDVIRERAGVPVAQWKVQNKTAIPAGTYSVIFDFSAHFQREMLHVENVPGFDGIRIHAGNTAVDTDGCILVGAHHNGAPVTSLLDSRVALLALEARIREATSAGETVEIQIINPLTPAT